MTRKRSVPSDGTTQAARDRLRQALATGGDDTNPEFLFSTTHTVLLQAIEVGLIDPGHLVHCELVRRGLGVNGAECGAHEVQVDTPAADSAGPEADTTAETTVADIARRILHVDTIDTRNSDALDFHELAVWSIRDSLMAAYTAGAQATSNGHATGEG